MVQTESRKTVELVEINLVINVRRIEECRNDLSDGKGQKSMIRMYLLMLYIMTVGDLRILSALYIGNVECCSRDSK